ncbi:MAG: hypothetical protein H6R19_775 [Proteobacteria bacterium]|nr:hypothetical protein [Pseudomonadota bacterium]
MKHLALFGLSLLLSCNAFAQYAGPDESSRQYDQKYATGPFYTEAQINAFDISGFKLGMSQDEAQTLITNGKWNGKFNKYTIPTNMPLSEETETKSFYQDERHIFLFRHWAPGKVVRVYSIKLKQQYKLEHTINDVVDALVKKYGKPTFNKTSGRAVILRWRMQNLTDKPLPPCTAKTYDEKQACKGAYARQLDAQSSFPELVADVTVDRLELTLTSEKMMKEQMEAFKKEQEAAADATRKQNNKAEKLTF